MLFVIKYECEEESHDFTQHVYDIFTIIQTYVYGTWMKGEAIYMDQISYFNI